jgi:N-acetylmuramic acid 6-phosphate etherase
VAVTNSKLEDRALRILRDLAGVKRGHGRELLAEAGGSVKLALLMALSGLDAHRAASHLAETGPSLRAALAALPRS